MDDELEAEGQDDEERMPDPDAEDERREYYMPPEPEGLDRAKLNKQIAALRFKIANPKKFGRGEWSEDELAKHGGKLEELLAQRPPKAASTSTGPPRQRRGPSDLLGERRAFMRRLRHYPEGAEGQGAPLEPEPVKIEDLMKHAQKFGAEGVVETAVELGYGHDACVRLMDACDRAEAAAYRKDRPKAPPLKFGDSNARVSALLGTLEAA